MLALKLLKHHEGFRSKPYRDTVGKLTIGYGRNLDDVGISEEEGSYLLQNNIREAEAELRLHLAFWDSLDHVRRAVLTDMAVNMGINKLLSFKNTLRFVGAGWYESAAEGMLASKWATQVKGRAVRLAEMMRTGKEPTDV